MEALIKSILEQELVNLLAISLLILAVGAVFTVYKLFGKKLGNGNGHSNVERRTDSLERVNRIHTRLDRLEEKVDSNATELFQHFGELSGTVQQLNSTITNMDKYLRHHVQSDS